MRFDTVIAGAGVIGLSIGCQLARRGSSVAVVGPADLPGSATRVAAGMLAPVTEAAFGEDVLTAFNLASADRFRRFADELADVTGLPLVSHCPGTMFVAADADEAAVVARLFQLQSGLGIEVTTLDHDACHELEPALAPSILAGSFTDSDKECNPRLLTEALRELLVKSDGELHAEQVDEIVIRNGRASGVRVSGRLIEAETVVLAAGAWSGRIRGAPPEVTGAMRPVKGQVLRLGPTSVQGMPVRHVIRGVDVYLVPRESELVVGASIEEKGFDTTVTAAGASDLLRSAERLIPAIREMEVLEIAAGLRPATPDNGPLLGETSVRGVVAATGHFRNGILQSALTADAICELIVSGRVPPEIAPFSPLRFSR